MVVFLLLLIVAILLFGSSKVLGVIGAVLGFFALVLALFFGLYAIASTMNLTVDDILVPACIVVLVVSIVGYLVVWMLNERKKAALEERIRQIRRGRERG